MTLKETGEVVLGLVVIAVAIFILGPILYGAVKVFHHGWLAVLEDLGIV